LLKYNGLAIERKTTKLTEGGHRGLQDYKHINYFYVFYVFNVLQNPKSRDFLRFLPCFVRTFSRTGFMFGARVAFSGSADRKALFRVISN